MALSKVAKAVFTRPKTGRFPDRMAISLKLSLAAVALAFAVSIDEGPAIGQPANIVAAVLPSSRSVPVGQTATAFATIINTGTVPATGCAITPSQSALSATLPIAFYFQATNAATNALTGTPNTAVAVAPGKSQTFIFGVVPTASFGPTNVTLNFQCANSDGASVVTGLNTLLLSGASGPDVVALSATTSGDGIVNLPAPGSAGAFSVATINLGTADSITATADTGSVPLPVSIALCATDPISANCLAPPAASVSTMMSTKRTQTFSVFVKSSSLIPLDPNSNRVTVRFTDSGGNTVGSTSVAIQNSVYEGPLTISAGGVYSGNWESLDPNQPAIVVNTPAQVVIQNCFIRSKSDIIRVNVDHANVQIQNCRGFGLDPGVAGQTRGYFFRSSMISSLVALHNYIQGTSFGFNNYGGMQSSSVISIQYNVAYNLDGVPSDGKGGRTLSGLEFGQDNGNHFIILDSMQSLANATIAWNQIVTDPYVASLGDIINIYRSSGTKAAAIQIHDNYMFGSYSARVDTVENCCGPNANTSEGIAIDGSASDTPTTTSAFVQIFNNQIVNQGGAQGLGINVGHDNQAYGNRIISTGQLFNGVWMAATYSNALTVGNFVYNQPSNVFFNNSAHDNTVAWLIEVAAQNNQYARIGPPIRSDLHLVDCSGNCGQNISLPDPVTDATQNNELSRWLQKLKDGQLTVGPTD